MLGLKHSESDNPTFKARIVLQGSDVRDAFNQAALFGQVSSTPTNLNTIRSVVTYSCLGENFVCEQSDAEAAYTQHVLTPEDGDPVWIRLPANGYLQSFNT